MSVSCRRGAAMAVAIVVAISGGGALAQKRDKTGKAAAKKLLAAGDRKFARADYDGALAEYMAAYDAYPDMRIYYAVAGAEEKLGRHMDAYRHYAQLLEEGADLKPELRREVQRRFEAIKTHLA